MKTLQCRSESPAFYNDISQDEAQAPTFVSFDEYLYNKSSDFKADELDSLNLDTKQMLFDALVNFDIDEFAQLGDLIRARMNPHFESAKNNEDYEVIDNG